MTEDGLLLSFVGDRMLKCSSDYMLTSTLFLDVRQQSLVLSKIKNSDDVRALPFGGFDTAERNVLVFIPYYLEVSDFDSLKDYLTENPEENPLTVLHLKKDSFSTVSHRDYLGALMGLGIKREMVGDIVVTNDGADIIVMKSVAEYIKAELKSVGRASVTVSEVTFDEISDMVANVHEEIINVSSMRIDNIISACFRLSRSESADAVLSGNVYVNSLQILKCDKKINIGDKIVYRSKGKVVLKEVSGVSKKGRNFIKIDVYS